MVCPNDDGDARMSEDNINYDSWLDAVLDCAIDPCEALSRWLDGEDASDHNWEEESAQGDG